MATPTISETDRRLLKRLEQSFAEMAGADLAIDVGELQKALGLRSAYLARRMLSLFDTDGDGLVRRDEFLHGVRALVYGSLEQKLAFAFRLHDHDGNGTLDRDEVQRMLAIGLAEDDVAPQPAQLDRLVAHVFASADQNRDGRITYDELAVSVHARPALLHQMTVSEARWLAPNEELLAHVMAPRVGGLRRLARTLENRAPFAAVMGLWAVANLAAFVWGAASVYGNGTPRSELFWMLSAACTTCIKLNAALIVVPVLRRLWTWARTTPAARVLPIDDATDFHRYVGTALYLFTTGHVFAAVGDYAANAQVLDRMHSQRAITGLAWFVVFTVMWALSRTAVRRSGSFEVFYVSHLLYVVWFVLAALHASSVVALFGLPLVGFGVELLLRTVRRGRRVRAIRVTAEKSGVTCIELERPEGFSHRAGDWVFVRIPSIAKREWHPFTVSSAPERSTLTLHIRTLGNWTSALRRLTERADPTSLTSLAVHLDGPFGSATGRVFEARVPVMIGAGIGVTPFASVLESLMLRARAGTSPSPLQKGYFFWLNRDQYSFEWFRDLLIDLEHRDARANLEVQIWMTQGRAGATAVGLELARTLAHEAGDTDVISGLKTQMHLGHPEWDGALQAIAAAHAPDKPEVFFCGPAGLGRKIRASCLRLGLSYREERF